MSRRWSLDPDVEDELRALIAVGHSPPRALERLSQDTRFADRLPSRSTAYRIAATIQTVDGERWSFATSDPDEARLVLPVLAAIVGDVSSLSRETAGWIARVRAAAPALAPYEAFLWALRYQAAVAAGRPTVGLDRRLAAEITEPTRPSS